MDAAVAEIRNLHATVRFLSAKTKWMIFVLFSLEVQYLKIVSAFKCVLITLHFISRIFI